MDRLILKVLLLFAVSSLMGCSSVKFYEETAGGVKDLGFLYYPPKPYLLVGTKDGVFTTSIITLPDLQRPHRVKQKGSWGSSELGFTVNNGMISTFNSKSDTKGPETLSAIAGLGSANAAIIAANAAAYSAENALEAVKGSEEIIQKNEDGKEERVYIGIDIYIIKSFTEGVDAIENSVLRMLNNKDFPYEFMTLRNIATKLNAERSIRYTDVEPPIFIDELDKRRALAKRQAERLKNIISTLQIYANNEAQRPDLISGAAAAIAELKPVMNKLYGFSLRENSLAGLYEINYINGRLNLIKVLL